MSATAPAAAGSVKQVYAVDPVSGDLPPGRFESMIDQEFQNAFDQAVKLRDVIRSTIKPGRRADETLALLNQNATQAGFEVMKEFNKPTAGPKTDVIIGCHSVGNTGHGIGPSIAWFNPLRLTYTLKPTNLLSIEFFAYTAAPEFGGSKVRIPLEDDAIVTERGIEWLYPINGRILLVK